MELPLLEPQGPRSTSPTEPPVPPPSRLKGFRDCSHWCAGMWQEAWADIRHAKWEDGLLWVPVVPVWIVLIRLVTLTSLPDWDFEYVSSQPNTFQLISPGCRTDGTFGVEGAYNRWGLPGLFQITLRSGPLTFAQAKVIDVAWDVIVGRLGQTVLVYYSWKALSTYVRVSMETRPATFETFFTIYLEDAASIKSTARMIRDFSTRQRLQSRIAMGFIITSMLYILAWPTLAGAMTGYTSAEKAYMSSIDGNLTPMDKVYPVLYVIHDSWRINLRGNYLVTAVSESIFVAKRRLNEADLGESRNYERLLCYSGLSFWALSG